MSAQTAPSLTDKEKKQGWKLLFDGKSLAGWRAYKTETPPAGWRAAGGELIRDGEGGDLMTVEQFGDFELRLDWKITKRRQQRHHLSRHDGRTVSVADRPGVSGPRQRRPQGRREPAHLSRIELRRRSAEEGCDQAGWRVERIILIVKGNARRALDERCEAGRVRDRQPRLGRRVKASKFGKMPGYGLAKRGYIALQDHGNVVSYRNIKISPI